MSKIRAGTRSKIYTSTRTGLIFNTAETAPSAEKVIDDGALITNKHGNIALTGFVEDGETVIIDRSTEPPTLHLKGAGVTALYGYTDGDGEFVQYKNEASSNSAEITGIYTGPSSQLRII